MQTNSDYRFYEYTTNEDEIWIFIKVGTVIYSNRNGVFRPFDEDKEEIPDEEEGHIRATDAIVDVCIRIENSNISVDIPDKKPHVPVWLGDNEEPVRIEMDIPYNRDEAISLALRSLCKLLALLENQIDAGNIPGVDTVIPPGNTNRDNVFKALFGDEYED